MRVLVLGTSSGAGKTTICAMICRYLSKNGHRPAPFKGSNLSLNSIATEDGGEIGMGQAFQAWSAGIAPETDMNPVLMKPSGNGVMQLIVNGRPLMDVSGSKTTDHGFLMREVHSAYDRLASKHDAMVCEGSGSPVELNIMDRDIANVGLMRELGIPTIIVGDIERGGVFAALYGTWRLIPDDLKHLVKGYVINRFRGEASILKDGIDRINELTGMECLGVLPYENLRFPEEDSLSSSEGRLEGSDARTAFMDNMDEMLADAEKAGFDFEALKRIMAG